MTALRKCKATNCKNTYYSRNALVRRCLDHQPRPTWKFYWKLKYQKWRDQEAKPYLDKKFGRKCNNCKAPETSRRPLDVDHIIKRSIRPDLRMTLTNVQYLCRECHIKKDNQ